MKKQLPLHSTVSRTHLRPGWIANIPNAISLLRLFGAPILFVTVLADRDRPFRWLLIIFLLSDVADGMIARRLKVTSEKGALLDSAADILISVVAAFAVFRFQPDFVSQHASPILLIIALYLLSVSGALVRYGKLASFHTFGCRLAANAQGVFVVLLLFHGYEPIVFRLMIGISTVAYLEELTLLWLLPTWSTDVGGLYRLLRKPAHPTEIRNL